MLSLTSRMEVACCLVSACISLSPQKPCHFPSLMSYVGHVVATAEWSFCGQHVLRKHLPAGASDGQVNSAMAPAQAAGDVEGRSSKTVRTAAGTADRDLTASNWLDVSPCARVPMLWGKPQLG